MYSAVARIGFKIVNSAGNWTCDTQTYTVEENTILMIFCNGVRFLAVIFIPCLYAKTIFL